MIELNLLPEKVRAQETLRMIIIAAVAAYLVGAAVIGWQWRAASAKVAEALNETQKVQAELDAPDLQEAVKAVQKFSEDLAAVKSKQSQVDQLRKDQVTMVRLLDSLPDWTLNGQVWFTNVEFKGDKGHHSLSLAGSTLSRALYAKFYSFMENQPLVSGISMDSPPSPSLLRGTPTVQFHLSFSTVDYQ